MSVNGTDEEESAKGKCGSESDEDVIFYNNLSMNYKYHDITKHLVLEFERRRTIITCTLNSITITVTGVQFSVVTTCISRNM